MQKLHLPQLYLMFYSILSNKSIGQNCVGFVVLFLSAVHCGLEPGHGQVNRFLASPVLKSKRKDMWNWNQDSVRG